MKKRSIKRVSIVFLITFILSIFFTNFNPFSANNNVTANAGSSDGSGYEVLNNITWSRTPDIKEYKDNSNVIETRNTVYDWWEDKLQPLAYSFSNNYWTESYNQGKYTYTLNKTNNNKKGILQTTFLFAYANNFSGYEKCNIVLDYNTLTSILNPTQKTDVWDGKSDNFFATSRINDYKRGLGIPLSNRFGSDVNDFATWYYKSSDAKPNYKSNGHNIYEEPVNNRSNGDQLRMFRGEFNLTQDEVDNYDYYITTGGNNPELILPLDDTMFVLVDEQQTGLNFTTAKAGHGAKLNIIKNGVNQELTFNRLESFNNYNIGKTCYNDNHGKLSKFSDGWHAHLNDYVDEDGVTIANVSDIIKSKGAGSHKIEIFASDYNSSGGMTKLDIVKIRKPNVTVKKEAINASENNIVISDGVTVGTANVGNKINYRLTYENNSVNSVKNVEIEDANLGVIITKDGYKVNGQSVTVPSTLRIINGTVTKTGQGALSLLNEIKPGQKIVITDETYLTTTAAASHISNGINNTVRINSTYFNEAKTGAKEASCKVNVIENINLSVEKYIKEIIRNNQTIFSANQKEVSSKLPRIYSGDKIIFGFNLRNNSNSVASNIKIQDIISNSEDSSIKYDVSSMNFINSTDPSFNTTNYTLPGKGSVYFESSQWTVPDNARYLLNNTINVLNRNDAIVATDNCEFTVYPKVYVTMNCVDDLEKQFYVTITGSDGFKTGMYLKNGEQVEVDNLKFGVDYTVKETVPMNFVFQGMDINGMNNSTGSINFNLKTIEDPSVINLYNTKNNSNEFRDEDEVTNSLKLHYNIRW